MPITFHFRPEEGSWCLGWVLESWGRGLVVLQVLGSAGLEVLGSGQANLLKLC